ncbi:MAG: hypothetical protein LC797_23760 [Chloroflexi bacterium]|nr:hypothetical protein [Chloroflexota bacterium]
MSHEEEQTTHWIEMGQRVECEAAHSPREIVAEPRRDSRVAELMNGYSEDDGSEKWKLTDKFIYCRACTTRREEPALVQKKQDEDG